MQKEIISFKRVSFRKETIYRIWATHNFDNKPTLRIVYKHCDVTRGDNNMNDVDFIFNNEESVLEVHYKLIELLNRSKDSDFIDVGRLCDEVKNEVNKKIDEDNEKIYYKNDN